MYKNFYLLYPAPRYRKIFRIMKLTTFLLLAALLHVSAAGLGQQLSLTKKQATLQEIFEAIHTQTGYSILWVAPAVYGDFRTDVNFRQAPLQTVLDKCVEGLPLTYTIEDRLIVVKQKKLPGNVAGETPRQQLHGKVIDTTGNPLPGTSIFVRQSRKGAIADAKGEFVLENTGPSDTLIVRLIGYQTQVLTAAELEQNGGFVILKTASNELDKVVIQAYGITNKRLTTGNIVTVKGEEIASQPVMNPMLALEGKVPGMVVTPQSGYASGRVTISIRGRNNLNDQFITDPLYIIDGVPQTYLDVNGMATADGGSNGVTQGMVQSGIAGGGQSPFFNLNPASIESITVLKDADATAIYGSRGANGVVIITTKKGSSQGSRFNVSLQQGFSKASRRWDMLNTPQYLQMRKEAFANAGVTPTAYNAPDLLSWDTTSYTNWQKTLWGRSGKVTTATADFSGGNNTTQFRIGGAYTKSSEITSFEGANQRYNLDFSLSHHTLNNKLSITLSANYSYTDVKIIQNTAGVANLAPNTPPAYDSTGNLNWQPWVAAGIGYNFPYSYLADYPYTSSTYILNSNLLINYQVARGLNFTLSTGYMNSLNNNAYPHTIAAQDPTYSPTGTSLFSNSAVHNLIIEPQVNYKNYLFGGEVSVLAGVSKQVNTTDAVSLTGAGYTSDFLLHSITNAAFSQNFENYGQYKYAAVYGRISYNLKNRYLLNLNGRRDGSSRFGPGSQFGNFGSAGAAWIVSDEPWMKHALPGFFDFLKLRGSYGITGSDAINDYQYLSQWNNQINYGAGYSYGGVNPLFSQHAVNREYKWQVNKKLEVAVDLGFFKDRLTLDASYYRDRCDDQLLSTPTPIFSGFNTVVANLPATVQNSGLELQASGKIISRPQFSWQSSFNISFNRNRLLAFNDIEHSSYVNRFKIGESLNSMFLLHNTGVDPATGEYTYAGINLNYSVPPGTNGDDRTSTVDLAPRYTGSFSNALTYKNWMLHFIFIYKKQMGRLPFEGTSGSMLNISQEVFDSHWQKPGDNAQYARFTTQPVVSDVFYTLSDGAYADASFIRLQHLSFSYNLPGRVIRKWKMQSCSINFLMQNLFVITGYKGIDPDVQNFGAMPLPRTISGGISLGF